MKSSLSVSLRIAICEYTILRTFTIMFSFLVAMFSFPAVFHVIGVLCGWSLSQEASEADVFDPGMHFFTRASTARSTREILWQLVFSNSLRCSSLFAPVVCFPNRYPSDFLHPTCVVVIANSLSLALCFQVAS